LLWVALMPGCALLGESEARKRWRDTVEVPIPPPPAPEAPAPTPESEEEGAILSKDGLGLDDCLRLAVLRSEKLRARSERVLQTDIDQATAIAGLFPTATYTFQYFRQDEPPNASSVFPSETRTHKFTFRQPLFRGFRDWNTIAAASDRHAAEEARLRAEKLSIAQACGTSFFAVIGLERSVETLRQSLVLEDARLAEVRARESSGIARRTEVLFVETGRTRTAADLARAQNDLAGARARLAFYTGRADARLLAAEGPPNDPGELAKWLDRLKDRPDVAALGHEVEVRRREVSVARGQLLPNADVVANYYARRDGLLEDSRWDFLVQLEWPIDGKTLGTIRGAESRLREAEREHAGARDRARADIEVSYHQLRSSLATISALEGRVRLAEENVKLLDAEYKAGIATNLEAVQAEDERRQARLDLDRELFNARRLEVELRATSGDDALAPGPYPSSPRDR
jgi:outer membrane protein TolC